MKYLVLVLSLFLIATVTHAGFPGGFGGGSSGSGTVDDPYTPSDGTFNIIGSTDTTLNMTAGNVTASGTITDGTATMTGGAFSGLTGLVPAGDQTADFNTGSNEWGVLHLTGLRARTNVRSTEFETFGGTTEDFIINTRTTGDLSFRWSDVEKASISATGEVTGSSFTDGTATLTGGSLSSTGTVTLSPNYSAGATNTIDLSGYTGVAGSDDYALYLGANYWWKANGEVKVSSTSITGAQVSATTLTDGTATITGGNLTGVGNIEPGAAGAMIIGNTNYINKVRGLYGWFDSIASGAGDKGPNFPQGYRIGGTQTVTATSDTLTKTDTIVLIDSSSNAVTINLPAAAGDGISGKVYVIKAIDVSNTCTVDGNASETIDGSTTYVFSAQYEAISIICDGSNWHIF